jgi:ABC-type uncharacterized transport system substrate-binding protein
VGPVQAASAGLYGLANNPLAQISRLYVDLTKAAADQLGLTVGRFEASSREELESAFTAMAKADMQAVLTNGDGLA